MSDLRMSVRDWGLLLLLSVLWGGTFFFTSIALKEVDPFWLAYGRVSIAALTLSVGVFLLGLKLPARLSEWRAFITLAIFGNAIPFTLFAWAQTRIPGGLAAILNAMVPIFTILLAHVLTKDEKITLQRLTGVIAGVLGVATIVGPSALSGHSDQLWAEAAALCAALCYALAGVYGRRFGGYQPLVISFTQLAIGSVLLLPVTLIFGGPLLAPPPSLTAVASIAAIGAVSTALGFIIYFSILRRAGATNAGLVTVLIPVSAILLGVMFLGEVLVPRQYAGLALIAAGLLIIDGRPLQMLSSALQRFPGRPDRTGRADAGVLNEPHNP